MNSSDKRTKSALSIWQFALLITTTYIVGLFISHRTTVIEATYWSGYELQVLNDDSVWVDSNRMQIGSSNKVQDIRFNLNIDDSDKWKQPISLMIGGPFSAEIYWDGESIGKKGAVGNVIEDEIAGPIDSSLFVPSRLLTQGNHQIQLQLSTQHLIAHDASVFHYIWLMPYRQDGQRDLRYYAAPLVILSALIVLSLQSFRIGRSAGNLMHTGLGLFGFCITIALMAEVSRAVINYPYHYHELRGIFGWIGNIGAGLALIYTCYRLVDTKLTKLLLIAGIASVLASYFVPMNSGDMRMAQEFSLLTLAPSLVFIILLFKRQVSYLSSLPIFWLACVISQILSIGLFLDSFLFIASLILIGGAWVWTYVDNTEQTAQPPTQEECQHFNIRSAGEVKTISVNSCYALKGEGNFTSVMLLSGESVLHQDGLGVIMKTNPKNFFRVHKSFAVNINATSVLRSAEGSKYWLEMTNKETIPVSRYRVTELRGLLKRLKTR